MDKNQETKSVNAINYPEDESMKANDYGVVSVDLKNRKSKPRTAAQPQFQKNTVFSKELDPSSYCHSTINIKFVYCVHCCLP